MHHFRLSRTFPVLLVTAGLAVSGCGSSDEGGDEATYFKTYEAACKKMLAGQKSFESEIAALDTSGDEQQALSQLRSIATRFLDGANAQLTAMADADAPSKFADSQRKLANEVDKFSTGIDKAKRLVVQAKTAEEFAGLGDELDKLGDLGLTDEQVVPDEVLDKAPTCGELGSAGDAS